VLPSPAMRLLVAIVALAATTAAAQSPTGFEVVSIKRASAIEHGGGSSRLQPGGRFMMTNGPVRVLLGWAYGNPPNGEIAGAPDWVTSENYDLEARAGRDISTAELAPLMRDLLATRFKLQAHLETRVRQVYELRVARADRRIGPAMRPSSTDCDSRQGACSTQGGLGTGEIVSNGISMARFATWLPALVGRPVIDKTDLHGYYEVSLKYSIATADDAPVLPTALREQLGLMLQPVNAPTEFLVIDHIERPTEN
jgi:uncharacterized protein (TIGR03435 family)